MYFKPRFSRARKCPIIWMASHHSLTSSTSSWDTRWKTAKAQREPQLFFQVACLRFDWGRGGKSVLSLFRQGFMCARKTNQKKLVRYFWVFVDPKKFALMRSQLCTQLKQLWNRTLYLLVRNLPVDGEECRLWFHRCLSCVQGVKY